MPLRYLSIHAHFYQPPREDPFTGHIPNEIGASPYKNWNERIHAECYRPNADLRNFEQISFNIGPTLANWMVQYRPETFQNIVAQDRRNVLLYGVGNAMAQSYNHTILPLANRRDKITQVVWGIADFQYHFGRKPQGMWLPETAADTETLQILAEHGIEFAILAPWQAETSDLDPGEAYLVNLPGGRRITVFFYNRDLSGQISFDPGCTVNADTFARNLLEEQFKSPRQARGEPQLVVLASDGELYGHHQRLRERFLARLVDGASSSIGIQPVFPALWLKLYPARKTLRIRENTSWSCHHGVGRWNGLCPCTPGDGKWKQKLRQAFDRLATELDELFIEVVRPFAPNPWRLRDEYIQMLLGQATVETLVAAQSNRSLTSGQVERVHWMLEAQRERQRMYTSCGWFFDDFDRIEPRNNVAYAAQAVRLARLASGVDLRSAVLQDLEQVVSPRTKLRADVLFQRLLDRAEKEV